MTTDFSDCNYDRWPDELKAVSMRTVIVPLSDEERRIISDLAWEQPYKGVDLHSIVVKIDFASSLFPKGFFVKLMSRSPKDSYHGHQAGFKCSIGADVLPLFVGSERIGEDIMIPGNDLLIREWVHIPPKTEWRCFQRDGKLVGASQYFYRDVFDINVESAYEAIREFHEKFSSLMPRTVVFDLALDSFALKYLDETPLLIELNPWIPTMFGTDPCLFAWEDLEVATEFKLKYNTILTKDYPEASRE